MKLNKLFNNDKILIGYVFYCPGCEELHWYKTCSNEIQKGPQWNFNENLEKPTFNPSLLLKRINHICHLFLHGGKLKFLGDCTHKLAGITIDLPELPEWAQ